MKTNTLMQIEVALRCLLAAEKELDTRFTDTFDSGEVELLAADVRTARYRAAALLATESGS